MYKRTQGWGFSLLGNVVLLKGSKADESQATQKSMKSSRREQECKRLLNSFRDNT